MNDPVLSAPVAAVNATMSIRTDSEPMICCHRIESSPATGSLTDADDSITLDETDRHRRRYRLTSDNGIEFLLELDTARLIRQDDILCLTDGRRIRVKAKPEPLYAIRGRDAMHLLHLTWHVGNRHLATAVMTDHILIRRDPVIRDMLIDLGASVEEVSAGFNPLGGAYGDAHGHNHDHAHDHDHDHDHAHAHDHDHDHDHSHDQDLARALHHLPTHDS